MTAHSLFDLLLYAFSAWAGTTSCNSSLPWRCLRWCAPQPGRFRGLAQITVIHVNVGERAFGSGAIFYLGSGDAAPLHTTGYDLPDRLIETAVKVFMELAK